jgi:glycosyltransferase involved in cell wall biosynthesis
VNEPLYQRERNTVADAQLIGHGVDFAQFSQARSADGPTNPPPPDMASLPRPIVGFYGGMDEYRMDVDLMVNIARHLAERGGTFVLIGPEQMDLSRVKAEPNVRSLGQKSPDELPAYAGQFDVGVIPFLRNEFNSLCNPTKLKEYLAAGFPIVATDLPAFRQHSSLLYTAASQDEFLEGLDRALSECDSERVAQRRNAVADSSWETVAGRVANMLAVPPKLNFSSAELEAGWQASPSSA